jgi:hypothetical protein
VTTTELKAKAASRYPTALKKVLLGENPFPLSIPYKRPARGGDPAALIRLKNFLRSESKAQNGFGPTIKFETARTRKFGDGVLAGDISFDSLDDISCYIGKKAETDRVLAHAAIVVAAFPETRNWIGRQLRRLPQHDAATWRGIVEAVRYFRDHPKPWIYPREVPIGLPTKFLETNHTVVIDLLLSVAPEALNDNHTNWHDRLGLRSSSEMIEGRFLDASIAPHLPQHLLAPVKEWNRCSLNPSWILITENRTTLLTLGSMQGCLALLGKGYAANRLAEVERLGSSRVVYWGDIDQHGFEILASLRSLLPKVESCLMNDVTLRQCPDRVGREHVSGTLPSAFLKANLTFEEYTLWQKCALEHLRLEQEKIPSSISMAALQRFCRE